jgi:hypothetical protein
LGGLGAKRRKRITTAATITAAMPKAMMLDRSIDPVPDCLLLKHLRAILSQHRNVEMDHDRQTRLPGASPAEPARGAADAEDHRPPA